MASGVWTEKEINYLRENYKEMSNKELAEALKRPWQAVSTKLHTMQLKRYGERTTHPGKEPKEYREFVIECLLEGKKTAEIKRLVEEKYNVPIRQSYIGKYGQMLLIQGKIEKWGRSVKVMSDCLATKKAQKSELDLALENTGKILGYKQQLKQGDVIKFKSYYGVMEKPIEKKYVNFVHVMVNGRLESVPYCDILEVKKRAVTA